MRGISDTACRSELWGNKPFMKTHNTAEALAERRRIAALMLDEGMIPAEVARHLHVSRQSVCCWRVAYLKDGLRGLQAKPHPGPQRKLNRAQRRRLQRLLLKGAEAFGYGTDLWTRQRVAKVIELEFGVEYSTDHMSRLLHYLGWTCQKPEKQARERNEEAIERWVHKDWPRIRKRRRGLARPSAS